MRDKARRSGIGLVAVIATALTTMASPSAHAAPAYRCGSPPEVRYQGQPCDGGQALHNADHRTEAQRADTTKATQANAKLGRQLARERRRQEQQGAGRRPIALDDGEPPAKPSASSTQGQTLKRTHPFTARVPKAAPAKPATSN